MRSILTLALKDLRLLWRDRFGMFWVLGFPMIFALFFGFIFSGVGGSAAGKMPIAVIDEDNTAGSRALVQRLKESDALAVSDDLACEEAKHRVRRGKLAAYVIVQKGFGDSWAIFQGQPPELEVGIDPSRQAEAAYLQGLLMESVFRGMRERVADRESMREQLQTWIAGVGDNEQLAPTQRVILAGLLSAMDTFLGQADDELLNLGTGGSGASLTIAAVATERDDSEPRSGFEIMFPAAMLWGLLGCCAGVAMSLVQERTGGTFLRLRTAPLSRMQILAGKGLGCFIASVGILVLMVVVAAVLFGVRVVNPPGLVLAIFCTAFCFVGLMMFFSVLGRSEQAVAGATWAILILMSMFGGGMIPLIFMPRWMAPLSNFSMVKWGIVVLQDGMWRGGTLAEMLPACAILLAVGAAAFAVGTAILARTDR